MSNSNNNSMMPQQYCLRWRYHHSNLQTMFSQLLEREAFCDVTLACDGRTIKAHKIVLSACSTYFDTILSQYEEKDPILIMKDVKFVDIKCLVEFMYKGEINVEHTHLATLLKTAEDLRIKGLAEVSWRDASAANATPSTSGGSGSTSGNSASNSTAASAASHNGIQHALANVATVMGNSPKESVGGGGSGGGGTGPTRQQQLLQQQLTMNKRKRGRPPIDDYEQPAYTLAPKIISVMSGSNAEESASNDDGTSASDHDNDTDHHGGQGSGPHHRTGGGASSNAGGGKASGSSQWDDDEVDRINSFGEHMLSGIRVKTELNTEDEYIDFDQTTNAVRSRTSTNASQLNNSTSSSTTANNASGTPSTAPATFNISQLEKEWPDVVRLNDYLNTGRRQQFWEEPFTKRVMDAIKTKNLEMKSAAELLGVSYGTLYGRYRDAYGCLKHPYSLSRSGLLVKVPGSLAPNANANPGGTASWIRDAWSDQGSTDIIMKLKRKEITLFKAAEQLKMTPQALSNYLISFSMGMDPEMANTVAKLLAQQSVEEGSSIGGQTSQLQLQLQNQSHIPMPPLRRLHSSSSRTNEDGGSILGDDDDDIEEEDEEEDEEEEEVMITDEHHPRPRHHQQQNDDDEEEDSILPDIPTKSNHHHSIISKPSALANCPDITIIRKEKLDQLISSSRVNNNEHPEQRGGSVGGLRTTTASNSTAGTAT